MANLKLFFQLAEQLRIKIIMKKKSVVVLVSGGMDSVVALYDSASRYDVQLGLSFDYGARHNHRELPLAELHTRRLGFPHLIVPMDFIPDSFSSALLKTGAPVPDGHYEDEIMRQTVVPFRNGIMLSIAAGIAESKGISGVVIAAHAGDHAIYPDCRPGFMDAMASAIEQGTYNNVELLRPFIAFDKGRIAARGLELGVDFSETWSCYKGGDYHCGVCGTCVERREAFQTAGIPDPTIYKD